ncbi:MAG TPA: MFS transporter [Mycobacteriales bacterium]
MGSSSLPRAEAATHGGAFVLSAFAGFGLVWGVYAAALPSLRSAADASDAVFGTALTGIGVAALPAMLLVGRATDRFGDRTFLVVLCGFALTAPLPTLAHSVPVLVVTLLAFGACSGGFDVSINHAAVRVETETGRRVLNRAHAMFSFGLLMGSVLTGLLRGAGVHPAVVLVTVTTVLLGGLILAHHVLGGPGSPKTAAASDRARTRRPVWTPFVVIAGIVGALALLVENGLQQWTAVFFEDILHTGPALAGLGPGVLAGSAVLGRLGGHVVGHHLTDVTMLACSGLLAAPGAVLVATATSPIAALGGLFLAGVGISVATPTLYRIVGRRAAAADQGRTISAVSALAYVGLLGGPGLVGQIAGRSNLRVATGALALAALAVAAAAPLLAIRSATDTRSRFGVRSRPSSRR